ncbi:MAG: ABC transporter permease [Acidobacteria bacterium]|nr:ABC transporter permease [Acidobacteriota bacterium]MCB9396390.1 ABC transporter permease [Acidobacteriota bacterium]
MLNHTLMRLGQVIILTAQFVRLLFSRKPEVRAWLHQFYHLGVQSLSITNITAIFTGMVLALQAAYALAKLGADVWIGDLVSLSIVRELGPVLSALLVGGRVGAGITAELGYMKNTQQIDAMRAMATDPIYKLVVPRMIACIFSLPLLTVIAGFLGILGGLLLAVLELHVDGHFFLSSVLEALTLNDIISGLGKTFFFGYFIGIIACNNGLHVEGGADGVGRSTTHTVVTTSITILISDFFLTKLFYLVTG